MLARIVGLDVGVPQGWLLWDVGTAEVRAEELVAGAATVERRAELTALLLRLDADLVARGWVISAAVWVPDIDHSGAVALARVEVQGGFPDRPVSRDELLAARRADRMRAFQVFDRGVDPGDFAGGPGVVEVAVLAEKRGGLFRRQVAEVETRVTVTILPSGSCDRMELQVVTYEQELLEAVVEQTSVIAGSMRARLGDVA